MAAGTEQRTLLARDKYTRDENETRVSTRTKRLYFQTRVSTSCGRCRVVVRALAALVVGITPAFAFACAVVCALLLRRCLACDGQQLVAQCVGDVVGAFVKLCAHSFREIDSSTKKFDVVRHT